MESPSTLILDAGGKVLWANRQAHRNVGLPAGGLVGRNYLEFCPPETHGPLLELHRRKLAGETVRFRLDLGPGRPKLRVVSAPVRVGSRIYLFVVGRPAPKRIRPEETDLGLLAAGDALASGKSRVDLNSCLLGALKDEAGRLRGRIRLCPGPTPPVLAHPWTLRLLLRYLLLRSVPRRGRLQVRTGNGDNRVWAEIASGRSPRGREPGLEFCRRLLRREGGRLRRRGRVLRLVLPVA